MERHRCPVEPRLETPNRCQKIAIVRFTSDDSVMNLGSEDKILEEASKIDEALVWG